MRLIDADALKDKWQNDLNEALENGADYIDNDIEDVYRWFAEDLESSPTIDPVKHGKWIPINERAAKCSLCGEWEYTNGIDKTGTAIIHRAIKHYCPNCGARMDGEE